MSQRDQQQQGNSRHRVLDEVASQAVENSQRAHVHQQVEESADDLPELVVGEPDQKGVGQHKHRWVLRTKMPGQFGVPGDGFRQLVQGGIILAFRFPV